MTKMIAVCEFASSEKQYEYLCDIPDGVPLEEMRYAVTYRTTGENVKLATTKSRLSNMDVVFVRELRPITDQISAGELIRLVLVFRLNDVIEAALRKQQIATLKANLERRLAEMSIFDKIRSLNITDEVTTKMAEELKKLLDI